MERKPKKVLIADDNPDTLNILSIQFKGQGYEVVTAADGAEALRKLCIPPLPDCVLLDLMMPKLNGYQVLEHMKEDPVLSNIPVIIITAKADKESKAITIAAGAREYLVKPVEPATVSHAVNTDRDRGKLCMTAGELGEAMFGVSDETAIKRIKESYERAKADPDYKPCPAWQDSNGRWCGYFKEVREWFIDQRKIPRPRVNSR